MIQFNLLPDVKIEYMKAVQKRQIMAFISFVVAGVCVAVFVVILMIVKVQQPKHISDLDKDIKANVATLQKNKDLNKILTIQNQLSSLPGLHDNKPMTSRIFSYLRQVVPTQATVSEVAISVADKKMTIKGNADTTATYNKFVDTLKFTQFSDNSDPNNIKTGKAFPTVVVTNFTIDSTPNPDGSITGSGGVTFELDVTYDEVIFKNTAKEGSAVANSVSLIVPNQVTTRSATQAPSDDLFKQNSTDKSGGGN